MEESTFGAGAFSQQREQSQSYEPSRRESRTGALAAV